MSTAVPKVKLNNGQEMPIVGLGTWRAYESDVEKAVKIAIDVGYRHIDTAFVYENEKEVGRAIRSKIDEGKITREDMFIVTKLAGIHHEPKLVEHACQKSLSNLGLSYIDLYLIHFPVGQLFTSDDNVHGDGRTSDVDYLDTWIEMEKLVDKKLVRGIGLSNFNAEQTKRILKNCRIKPVVNQVECHPGFNQSKLIKFSQEQNVKIVAYCPLARPQPERKWPPFIFGKHAQELSEKYGKTSAQICLKFLLQMDVVVIPKSITEQRIAENFNIFDFELSAEDIEFMKKYNTGRRMIPFSAFKDHQYFPFNAEF